MAARRTKWDVVRLARVLVPKYSVMVGQDFDGSGDWLATFPMFPGISGHGKTMAEAERQARTALAAAIEVYIEQGWPLPGEEALP